jgi:hypothetical protein
MNDKHMSPILLIVKIINKIIYFSSNLYLEGIKETRTVLIIKYIFFVITNWFAKNIFMYNTLKRPTTIFMHH